MINTWDLPTEVGRCRDGAYLSHLNKEKIRGEELPTHTARSAAQQARLLDARTRISWLDLRVGTRDSSPRVARLKPVDGHLPCDTGREIEKGFFFKVQRSRRLTNSLLWSVRLLAVVNPGITDILGPRLWHSVPPISRLCFVDRSLYIAHPSLP
jgi:hypothetical protein